MKTKTHDATARGFLFADDCAMNASSHQDMQDGMDLFATACTDSGLAISTKKTKVVHLTWNPTSPDTLTVAVENFHSKTKN